MKNTCLSLSFCFALSGLIQAFTALCLYFAGGPTVSFLVFSTIGGSFLFAALVFKEKNLRSKAIDLALVLLGMVFLYLGSR